VNELIALVTCMINEMETYEATRAGRTALAGYTGVRDNNLCRLCANSKNAQILIGNQQPEIRCTYSDNRATVVQQGFFKITAVALLNTGQNRLLTIGDLDACRVGPDDDGLHGRPSTILRPSGSDLSRP